jgi:lipoate-protein ligase B
MVEHPPVLTLGKGAYGKRVIAPELKAGALNSTTRTGEETLLHGPGKLSYPILDLEKY